MTSATMTSFSIASLIGQQVGDATSACAISTESPVRELHLHRAALGAERRAVTSRAVTPCATSTTTSLTAADDGGSDDDDDDDDNCGQTHYTIRYPIPSAS